MRAMVLERPGERLPMRELPDRAPGPGEVRLSVSACGVCRTDLHVVDGELPDPKLPLIPGHEIVGRVVSLGSGITHLRVGERVGVPWLGSTDGTRHKRVEAAHGKRRCACDVLSARRQKNPATARGHGARRGRSFLISSSEDDAC